MVNYKLKYLKYKLKYEKLKQKGGGDTSNSIPSKLNELYNRNIMLYKQHNIPNFKDIYLASQNFFKNKELNEKNFNDFINTKLFENINKTLLKQIFKEKYEYYKNNPPTINKFEILLKQKNLYGGSVGMGLLFFILGLIVFIIIMSNFRSNDWMDRERAIIKKLERIEKMQYGEFVSMTPEEQERWLSWANRQLDKY